MKTFTFLIISFVFLSLSAQEKKKDVQQLDTIVLTSLVSKKIENSVNLSKILNRAISTVDNSPTLTAFLTKETGLFFREYGRGMISGISVRGTGTSHTQILWNGIPLNSALNGQTDLNTLYLGNFNQLLLKKGGESIFFGSGALGGVIVMNHIIKYKKKKSIENIFNYGSFQTLINTTKITLSNKKLYLNLALNGNFSQNNYSIPDKNFVNTNGNYKGKDISVNAGFKFSKNNQIIFNSQYNFLDRNLSNTLSSVSKDKLITDNFRNALSWNYQSEKIFNKLTSAFVSEHYKYYFDKDTDEISRNSSGRYLIQNETYYQNKKNEFILGQNFTHSKGKGDGIGKHFQNTKAIYFSYKFKNKKWQAKFNLRKEFHPLYKIPFLSSVYLNRKIGKYNLGIDFSNNFRSPTYNDLYWNPGGNPDLKPEKSYTLEINQNYYTNVLSLNFNLFYIHSSDLIQWKPNTNNYWQPINIQEVISKGLEFYFNYNYLLTGQNQIKFLAGYTYQKVSDLQTGKLLTYTPAHLAHLSVLFKNKKIQTEISARYTGKIYTTTSNTFYLKPYFLLDYRILYKINNYITAGGGIFNITNTYYETFPARPQPLRNYNININIKID